MSTSIEAKRRRTVGLGSFTHITDVPVAPDGIQPEGVLFDGNLTDEQIIAVWWFVTSTDDADQARRLAIADLVADAEAGTHGTSWLSSAFAVLARYAIRYGTEDQ